MSTARSAGRYVVCLSNEGCRASLVPRRLYRVFPDVDTEHRGLLRVIDESGEDYLYPEDLFLHIDLPKGADHLLEKASCNQVVRRAARPASRC